MGNDLGTTNDDDLMSIDNLNAPPTIEDTNAGTGSVDDYLMS
jgi:hypothetical protein